MELKLSFIKNIYKARFHHVRIIKLLVYILIVLLVSPAVAVDYKSCVFVGTYTGMGSDGIYAFEFDSQTGEMGAVKLAGKTDNPSFLAVDTKNRFLYAVNEIDTFNNEPVGAISVFAVKPELKELNFLQQVSSRGAGPAHLSIDRSDRFLTVANYNGGNIAVFPIKNDGRLGNNSSFIQHEGFSVNLDRQTGPHAHCINVTSDNKFVIEADLGLDKVFIYRFDQKSGTLVPGGLPFVTLNPGDGPRHIAFDPKGRFMYVLNELSSTIAVFSTEAGYKKLNKIQSLSTLPNNFTGKNTAAEIAVDRKGRFLYASNRGHDSIAVFGIDSKSGYLTLIQHFSSGGKTPRHFTIDPSGQWLFAANQNSNNIRIFRIDQSSGRLLLTTRSLTVVSPVCLLFVTRR